WPQRSRLLGDQRGVRRAGARLPRCLEGRALLPRGAGARRPARRARHGPAQRRRRRHRPRPPGGGLRRAHRAAPPEDAEAHRREEGPRFHLHRRRPRRRDARRSRVRATDMDKIDTRHMMRHWRWDTDRQGLAWLTFDKAGESINTFSREALEELSTVLVDIAAAVPKGLIIRSAKGSFIGGADIQEFADFKGADD